ncbi:MAG: L-lactate dehydrogenase [Clostridia bacterium]|nr:L-lactate dehydrogenase [Clostridia bacterium]
MRDDKRKVALIGTGMVGMSYAFAMLNRNICDEIVLVDLNEERAEGEAMDLSHGIPFAQTRMRIWSGNYSDCYDADLAVITAGAPQSPGETRMDLLHKNAKIITAIVNNLVGAGFNGLILVASNPVDIMTMVAAKVAGFARGRVFGSGTTLDTARLRYSLGEHFDVDPKNVHAYVIGEHGDSEFVPWSQAMISTLPVTELCRRSCDCCNGDLKDIAESVKEAAYTIINAKNATYYGIAMALARITAAIFSDERSILTLSAPLMGEYGESGVCAGVPCVVGREGVKSVVELLLTDDELSKLHSSCELLRENFKKLN